MWWRPNYYLIFDEESAYHPSSFRHGVTYNTPLAVIGSELEKPEQLIAADIEVERYLEKVPLLDAEEENEEVTSEDPENKSSTVQDTNCDSITQLTDNVSLGLTNQPTDIVDKTQPVTQVLSSPALTQDTGRSASVCRHPGSGESAPVFNGFCTFCAMQPECPSTGGDSRLASPATLTHFNNHPTATCRLYHSSHISFAWGCPIHRGVLDAKGHCYYCRQELETGNLIPTQDLRTTYGYPGDHAM